MAIYMGRPLGSHPRGHRFNSSIAHQWKHQEAVNIVLELDTPECRGEAENIRGVYPGGSVARLSGHRKRGVWTIVIVLTGVSLIIAAAAGCTSADKSAESTVPKVDFSDVSHILAGVC